MKNNEMAQFSIGLILVGFLNEIVLDTDWWRAIDEYVYAIIFVTVMIFIFKKFGWKGVLFTFRVMIFLSIYIILGLTVFTALAWITLLFTPNPPLEVFFGYSSTWSTLLCCLMAIGIVVIIWKLITRFHWDID